MYLCFVICNFNMGPDFLSDWNGNCKWRYDPSDAIGSSVSSVLPDWYCGNARSNADTIDALESTQQMYEILWCIIRKANEACKTSFANFLKKDVDLWGMIPRVCVELKVLNSAYNIRQYIILIYYTTFRPKSQRLSFRKLQCKLQWKKDYI